MEKIYCEIHGQNILKKKCYINSGELTRAFEYCTKYPCFRKPVRRSLQGQRLEPEEIQHTEKQKEKGTKVKSKQPEKEEQLNRRIFYKAEFLRRNKKFQEFKEEYESFMSEGKYAEIMGSIEEKLPEFASIPINFLLELFEFDLKFPERPVSADIIESYDFPAIEVLLYDKNNKNRIIWNHYDFYKEGNADFFNNAVKEQYIMHEIKSVREEEVVFSPEMKFPVLSIDAVNREDKTVMVKVHLDRSREDIRRDLDFLLNLLDNEAKHYKVDFKKVKPQWDIYDKYIQVYDLKKNNSKMTWLEIAKEVFPDQVYKDISPHRKLPRELVSPLLKDTVRKYWKVANEMINKEGWKRI